MSSSTHPEHDVPPPALGGLLRLASQDHRERIYERLAAAGFSDVTRAQFVLIRWPGVDGLRPIEIAKQVGLSKQAVNDLLGDLERAGYVERRPHPADGRARIVRLTPRGWELQRTAHEQSRAVERSWAAVIGEERLEALHTTLEEMVARRLPT